MSSAVVIARRPQCSTWTHAARPHAGTCLSPALAAFWLSFPLMIAVYVGLYLFLRQTMLSAAQARFLFLMTLYLLPFVMAYLYGLDRVGTGRVRRA